MDAVMPIVWVWLVLSVIDVAVYARLRQRALDRAHARDMEALPEDHPARRLGRSHLRNHTLWLLAGVMSVTVALTIIARTAGWFSWEVPSGFSVVGVIWLLATKMLVGILDEIDNILVDHQLRTVVSLEEVEQVGKDTNERVRVIEETTVATAAAHTHQEAKESASDV